MWYIEEFNKRFTGFADHLSDLSTYIQHKEFFLNKQLKILSEQYRDKHLQAWRADAAKDDLDQPRTTGVQRESKYLATSTIYYKNLNTMPEQII